MKVQDTATVRREGKGGKRRYTQRDMAIIKLDQSILNSRANRGELVYKGGNHYISVCGCGVEGCFVHGSYENRS